MKIDKGNIEACLLDYIEGNLDPVMIAELMAFISENPEYEKWIPSTDDIDSICLSPDLKNGLKKDFTHVSGINDGNFEEFCIASTEGLLSDKDEERLRSFISLHPDKQGVLEVYQKLHLSPDFSITFREKEALKKSLNATIRFRHVYYAFAAAVAAAVVFMLLLKPTPEKPHAISRRQPVAIPQAVTDAPESREASLPEPARIHKQLSGKTQPDTFTSIPERKPEELAVIQPVTVASITVEQPMAIKEEPRQSVKEPMQPETGKISSPGSLISSLAKKVNIWRAAEKAVSGFNYLTESRLAISKTVDENGKVTSFGLASEEERPYPADKTK